MAHSTSTHNQLNVRVIGRDFSVALPHDSDDARRAHLHSAWQRCVPTESVDRDAIAIDCSRGFSSDSPESAWQNLGDRVATAITTEVLRVGVGEYLLFHAAGVATKDGDVLVLCAGPGTGKTTASAVLAKHFGYVSDEMIAVDPESGEVSPYPKPLQVIVPGSGSRKDLVGPDDLKLLHPPQTLRLRQLFILDRERDPAESFAPTIEPIDVPLALELLISQISSLYLLPTPLQLLCRYLADSAGPLVIRYAEADTLPALLADWLEEERPDRAPAFTWSPSDTSGAPLDAPSGSRFQRRAPLDAVQLDDALAILIHSEFFVLAGIGTTIWNATAEPATVDDVLARVVAEHGAHDDAAAIVSSVLQNFVHQGILANVP